MGHRRVMGDGGRLDTLYCVPHILGPSPARDSRKEATFSARNWPPSLTIKHILVLLLRLAWPRVYHFPLIPL